MSPASPRRDGVPGSDGVRLVGDIGGTQARFALLDAQGRPTRVAVLPVAGFATPEAAIERYLADIGAPRLDAAALAIAAPVPAAGAVRLTNAGWEFSPVALRARFALCELLLLNDFAALALALPELAGDELRQLGGEAPVASAPRALIGPGTGLGVATLVRAGDRWLPLAGEGGHVTLAAADEREAAILALARRELPHVSAERLVSGSGLPLLHRLVAAVDGRSADSAIGCATGGAKDEATSTEAIVAAALAGDASAGATIDAFCALLGNVAGNLALTVGARGGVYIGGGIVPRLGALFDRSPFRARFSAKGRFSGYLAAIPVYVILAAAPALSGAAGALRGSVLATRDAAGQNNSNEKTTQETAR